MCLRPERQKSDFKIGIRTMSLCVLSDQVFLCTFRPSLNINIDYLVLISGSTDFV